MNAACRSSSRSSCAAKATTFEPPRSVDTAIAHLESDEIDLIITDMQMPEKTGLDLILREAREISPEAIVDRRDGLRHD